MERLESYTVILYQALKVLAAAAESRFTTLTFSAPHGLETGDRIVLDQSAVLVGVEAQYPLPGSVEELDAAKLSGVDVGSFSSSADSLQNMNALSAYEHARTYRSRRVLHYLLVQ